MPALDFAINRIVPAEHAVTPVLVLELEVRQSAPPVPIQSISLQCQLRIEAQRRGYAAAEQERLSDLFGAPERFSRTLSSLLWTQINVVVPPFDDVATTAELPLPCSFDFNIAATKYFYALEHGEAPLIALFSGSVFYRDADGALAMELLSWDHETRCGLAVETWRQLMDRHYPNQTWLCLSRSVFDGLYEYKRRHGHTGFDEALAGLLANDTEITAS